MKITNISCEQFAGIGDRSVCFTDGINVIYGKNESGKRRFKRFRTVFTNANVKRGNNGRFLPFARRIYMLRNRRA